ncbi:MAG: hypothetical protein JST38_19185 [Bacteroidetes bacterium]|nr:hypothetical protein [Bacteroidota bacterium]MBS1942994.1 hypothetical protein [Bacteroidota bacterium]
MTTLDLRTELKGLIDRISDRNILEALRTIVLRQAEQDDQVEVMRRMALQSEEAIERGEAYTRAEVEQYLKDQRPKP